MTLKTAYDIRGLNLDDNGLGADDLPAGSYPCSIEQVEIVPGLKADFLIIAINEHRWGRPWIAIKEMSECLFN